MPGLRGATALPNHIHMIGIGGTGLSAIAKVLAAWGYRVTGSDQAASSATAALNSLGITTYIGHAPEHLAGAELVVISSAIPEANVELAAARERGIPVLKRRELLTAMMTGSAGICVAGTSGKTTTASMVAVLLKHAGLGPTFIVGGVIADLGTNAEAGTGAHFVIEADEYDRMFHGLLPHLAVVTNVELDHPDCYPDLAAVREAFGVFLDRVPPEGAIIACVDSPALRQVLAGRDLHAPTILTYGLAPEAQYRVVDVTASPAGGVQWRVLRDGGLWGEFTLAIPGVHNALNATAALLVAARVGIDLKQAGAILAGFQGALRRFELKGEAQGVTVIDDYAHHPTKVKATLAAARMRYPNRRLVAVIQPHTYSRIAALLEEFAAAFSDADEVIVTEVYAARASERATISGADLAAAIRHPCVRYIGGMETVVSALLQELRPGDVLLTLGAGDGYWIGEQVLAGLQGVRP